MHLHLTSKQWIVLGLGLVLIGVLVLTPRGKMVQERIIGFLNYDDDVSEVRRDTPNG